MHLFNRSQSSTPPASLPRTMREQTENHGTALRTVQVMLHNSRVYPSAIAPHDGDWVEITFLPSNPQINAAAETLLSLQEAGYLAVRDVEELPRIGGWSAHVKLTVEDNEDNNSH